MNTIKKIHVKFLTKELIISEFVQQGENLDHVAVRDEVMQTYDIPITNIIYIKKIETTKY